MGLVGESETDEKVCECLYSCSSAGANQRIVSEADSSLQLL